MTILLAVFLSIFTLDVYGSSLEQQKKELVEKVAKSYPLTPEQQKKLNQIIFGSRILSQGNPKIAKYALTKKECMKRQATAGMKFPNTAFLKQCGAPNMVPVYNVESEKPSDAKVCIDQFEFPNMACEYPVIWVRASEAAKICESVGKRLCDSHEWENACAAGSQKPFLDFPTSAKTVKQKHRHQKNSINNSRKKVWAYGNKQNHKICATGSFKSPECNKALNGGGSPFGNCGSNTYPVGSFPDCKSRLGVYDQHGNAAEHMNLPLSPSELTSRGGLGYTEMKGSWFIFSQISAHKDDCYWRAPFWHGGKVAAKNSHANYHLGFRCCSTVK